MEDPGFVGGVIGWAIGFVMAFIINVIKIACSFPEQLKILELHNKHSAKICGPTSTCSLELKDLFSESKKLSATGHAVHWLNYWSRYWMAKDIKNLISHIDRCLRLHHFQILEQEIRMRPPQVAQPTAENVCEPVMAPDEAAAEGSATPRADVNVHIDFATSAEGVPSRTTTSGEADSKKSGFFSELGQLADNVNGRKQLAFLKDVAKMIEQVQRTPSFDGNGADQWVAGLHELLMKADEMKPKYKGRSLSHSKRTSISSLISEIDVLLEWGQLTISVERFTNSKSSRNRTLQWMPTSSGENTARSPLQGSTNSAEQWMPSSSAENTSRPLLQGSTNSGEQRMPSSSGENTARSPLQGSTNSAEQWIQSSSGENTSRSLLQGSTNSSEQRMPSSSGEKTARSPLQGSTNSAEQWIQSSSGENTSRSLLQGSTNSGEQRMPSSSGENTARSPLQGSTNSAEQWIQSSSGENTSRSLLQGSTNSGEQRMPSSSGENTARSPLQGSTNSAEKLMPHSSAENTAGPLLQGSTNSGEQRMPSSSGENTARSPLEGSTNSAEKSMPHSSAENTAGPLLQGP